MSPPISLSESTFRRWRGVTTIVALHALALMALPLPVSYSQMPQGIGGLRFGMEIAPDVDRITTRALNYLADAQLPAGNWENGFDTHSSGRENTGVTGLALMAMLSTGEDPNSGPYAENIRAALRYIIAEQNAETGFLPNTMYNHGFGMLALSEAYGVVDESLLWLDAKAQVPPAKRRKLGDALRMAVECALKSQDQNPQKAWRYGPTSKDADTSVTGAVLIGLLAARNAGIPVPDQSLEDALEYLKTLTSRRTGDTSYTMGFGAVTNGSNLSAISALVMTIGRRGQWEQHGAASTRIARFVDQVDSQFPYYNMYYMAQALFQTDYEAWKRWNEITTRRLRRKQADDGSFQQRARKSLRNVNGLPRPGVELSLPTDLRKMTSALSSVSKEPKMKFVLLASARLCWLWLPILFVALLLEKASAQDLADLTLSTGQRIPVRVLDFDEDRWRISSPYFETEARVAGSAVQSVRFPNAKSDRPTEEPSFRVDLATGEVIVGTIVGWSDEHLSVTHIDLGTVTLPSDQVVRIARVGGNAQWLTAADLPLSESSAAASTRGTIEFAKKSALTCPIDVEADRAITLTFELEAETDFRLLLQTDDNTLATIQVSADGILSETEESFEFAEIELQLGVVQLALTVADGHLQIQNHEGKAVLRQPLASEVQPRLQILNDGAPLEFLSLCFDAPAPVTKSDEPDWREIRLVTSKGVVHFGSRISCKNGTAKLSNDESSQDIPIQAIQSVCFKRSVRLPPETTSSMVLWPNGTRLIGQNVAIRNSVISFVNKELQSGDELNAKTAGAIYFPNANASSSKGGQQLTLGTASFEGEFRWGEKGELQWLFDGFEEAVSLSARRKISISRFDAVEAGKTGSFDRLLLRNGTLLPCKIQSIDETGIEFQSPYCDAGRLENGSFRACFFTSMHPGELSSATRESIQRALVVPRFARDLEPSHVLIAANGDLLRGGLISVDEEKVAFDSRAELLRVDRKRIHAIVRLNDPSESRNSKSVGATTVDYGDDCVMVGEIQNAREGLTMNVPGLGKLRASKARDTFDPSQFGSGRPESPVSFHELGTRRRDRSSLDRARRCRHFRR